MKKNNKIKILKPLVGIVVFIAFSVAFKYIFNGYFDHKKHQIFGEAFGTSYYISIYTNKKVNKGLQEDINKKLDDVAEIFNVYSNKSIISKFNSNKIEKVEIPEFTKLFNISLDINKKTDYLYDPSIISLSKLWGFFSNHQKIPTQKTIDTVRKKVGMHNFSNKNGVITKINKESMLDFSSIAKGYGVDLVKELLSKKYGYTNFLIEIGGEVYAKGLLKDKPWRIGVASPTYKSNKVGNYILVSDKAVATSGNYNNFLLKLDKKYGHIISPKTGKPMSHGSLSTTVVHDNTVIADAWATALFLTPYDKALKIANKNGLAAMIIYEKNGKLKSVYSKSWKYKKLEQ